MPWKVVKKSSPKPFKIVRADTGQQVGESSSLKKAQASVRARYANTPEAAQPKKGFPG